MISLAYKISHFVVANHNPELHSVICTGVALFALVLHLNDTALSQSQLSIFFMCIIKLKIRYNRIKIDLANSWKLHPLDEIINFIRVGLSFNIWTCRNNLKLKFGLSFLSATFGNNNALILLLRLVKYVINLKHIRKGMR